MKIKTSLMYAFAIATAFSAGIAGAQETRAENGRFEQREPTRPVPKDGNMSICEDDGECSEEHCWESPWELATVCVKRPPEIQSEEP